MDFSLRSNRLALVLPVAAGIVAGAWTLVAEEDLGASIGRGFVAGIASFVAWATARELDPDHSGTAAFAAVAAPWLLLLHDPSLAGAAAIMLAARIVAGTTGSAPYPADATFVSLLAVWAAGSEGGLATAALVLLAMAGSTILDPRGRRAILVISGLGLAAAAAMAVVTSARLAPVAPGMSLSWMILTVTALTIVAMAIPVSSTTDRHNRPLANRRVHWAIAVTGTWVVLAVVWHGTDGIAVAGPVAAALAATALSALVARVGGRA